MWKANATIYRHFGEKRINSGDVEGNAKSWKLLGRMWTSFCESLYNALLGEISLNSAIIWFPPLLRCQEEELCYTWCTGEGMSYAEETIFWSYCPLLARFPWVYILPAHFDPWSLRFCKVRLMPILRYIEWIKWIICGQQKTARSLSPFYWTRYPSVRDQDRESIRAHGLHILHIHTGHFWYKWTAVASWARWCRHL